MNSKPSSANLQAAHLTVHEIAVMTGKSERSIHMQRELAATGRQDLVDQVARRELSVLGALKLAKPEKYLKAKVLPPLEAGKARRHRLVDAYNACTAEERADFIGKLRRYGHI